MQLGAIQDAGALPLDLFLGGIERNPPVRVKGTAVFMTSSKEGVPVVQTYGLTEAASQVATLAPEDALRKLGSAGKPLFPTELRVDAAPGQVGEILARGPTISPRLTLFIFITIAV